MITATYDGAERQFEIDAQYVGYFENAIGRSLYGILKAITEGQWTFADVAAVVSFGLHGPSEVEKIAAKAYRQARLHGFSYGQTGIVPRKDVLAVLERDGHGNYAELAADILADAIFRKKAAEGNEAA
ncbi:hypothetical protein [Mesorhizobium sp. SP-1A]|uniref:hypothetical protein n=1 Tax=Mesorhizobium sp. SP-1A TaxID=3077840 RepID=UPI0028F7470E|nr:hypothetical protein [Mesorhizobium sp. SP-1A]